MLRMFASGCRCMSFLIQIQLSRTSMANYPSLLGNLSCTTASNMIAWDDLFGEQPKVEIQTGSCSKENKCAIVL